MITNIFAAVFTVCYLGVTLWLCRGFRFNTRAVTLGAITIAMTCLLASFTVVLPTGCDITLGSWVPLMMLALVYDYRLSMISGMVCGILATLMLPGWSILHWSQIFLERLIVFSSMGYAGILGYQKRGRIILAVVISVALRMVSQVLTGVIFYGQYAWEGWGAWGYSILYHLSAKIPEGLYTVLILLALPLERFSKLAKGGKRA